MPKAIKEAPSHKIKKKVADLPVILLSHDTIPSPESKEPDNAPGIDRTFVWSGNTDILVYVPSVEALKAKVKKALFYPVAVLIVAFIVILKVRGRRTAEAGKV